MILKLIIFFDAFSLPIEVDGDGLILQSSLYLNRSI